jgi:sulfhydrogenase subunit beta (sulfur reductase)
MPTITKRKLLIWLNELTTKMAVVAPTRVGELVLFRPVKSSEAILLDFTNSRLSPKDWFFPATDSLFTIEGHNGHNIKPATAISESVMFGIHPCDARALRLLDLALLSEPADTVYGERRASTVLLGLACVKAEASCFCESIGGKPDATDDVDVLLTPVGDEYAVKMVTDKGRKLMATAPLEPRELKMPEAPEQVKVPVGDIKQTVKKVFENPYWDTLADRCLHCNICSYVCPTCYCFDIRDGWVNGEIERVRTWESCQSPGFTRIAGGYDPRPTKATKMRQRFCHKLLYFPEQYGEVACVGCGRCVAACPVNIDIREVMHDIQERGEKVDYARIIK